MNNAQRLKILTDSGRGVFSLKNLQSLWKSSPHTTKIISKRMADKNLIFRISRGYYSLKRDFNSYELANIIISPSYVSLNSSLFYYGVSFQISDTIHSVALLSYQRVIDKTIFKYYKIKKNIFYNLEGLHYKDNLAFASVERAIVDCFYFGLLPGIDNPQKINLTYLKKISLIYPQTVQRKVESFIKKL